MTTDIFRPFSIRHRVALTEKKIRPSLSRRLRARIWKELQEYNDAFLIHPYKGNNWTEQSTILSELVHKLLKYYGANTLEAFIDDTSTRKEVDLNGFVMGAYPAQVLDVVEMMYIDIGEESQLEFQQEINQIMRDEECPWILCDGKFVQMDSKFFEDEVLSRANELLTVNQFEGAKQEFLEARNDFTVGDYKGTIHNSCKAFESVLKSIENKTEGNANLLIKCLERYGFYKGLPESIKDGFGTQVLTSLPYLRNRLGGHGQGSDVLEVPKQIAKLALHLAGSLIVFLIEHNIELTGQAQINDDEIGKGINSHDIPF